jgi:hypothetical protein
MTTWNVPFPGSRIDLHVKDRLSAGDAERQTRTVIEILSRYRDWPGLVLADEVGMGKTFVALATAASVSWAMPDAGPVVVMVPSSLKEKWPRDFSVFRELCVRRPEDRERLRCASATSGVDFLKLLDDPRERRNNVIFLTHGALHRSLTDAWTKLAILRSALSAKSLGRQREAFPRFAADVVRLTSQRLDTEVFAKLHRTPVSDWRGALQRNGVALDDDPVPHGIIEVLRACEVDLGPLREVLGALPIKSSEYIEDRLQNVRTGLREVLPQVWTAALKRARFKSPLLILDEAHHLKNPATELASLFVTDEAREDAEVLDGALSHRFARMLFLTATPFQLGHHELLNILSRFAAIRWPAVPPRKDREAFAAHRQALERALDDAQHAGRQLDEFWGRRTAGDLGLASGDVAGLEAWWGEVLEGSEPGGPRGQDVVRIFAAARDRFAKAELLLRPLVIRHLRPRFLPDGIIERRRTAVGAAISGSGEKRGLPVSDEALLPFLLAARTQAFLGGAGAREGDLARARATFAEGLASSYEAYLHTRAATDSAGVVDEDSATEPAVSSAGELGWYLKRLSAALPGRDAHGRHPKVRPTVDRVADLWRSGEKVLVFCHYRQTSRAITRHVSAAIDDWIRVEGAKKLRCSPSQVDGHLGRLGDAFFKKEGRLHIESRQAVADMAARYPELDEAERERVVDVVLRFLRTPTFLVRYFPLKGGEHKGRLNQALDRPDASGLTLRSKLVSFLEFIARRCQRDERAEYLTALDEIQTGERHSLGREQLLPNVRLASGEVDGDLRRRLLLAFNTPFFPEVLVASMVLAEGVDLHLDCRYVIHHDLSWNPSTLEQRTGRIDRLGAKAERVMQPIAVFLPYLEGTQDEKMYRVVRDRERWFQVVMGEKFATDEFSTERLAERMPFPEVAAKALAMRLDLGPTAQVARG